MKKIAPITLMLLSSLLSYAYQVTVAGIVVGPGGNGVPETQVLIYSSPNDGFPYEKIVVTDQNGRFEVVIDVSDDVSRGALFISLVDCPNAHRRRIVFDPRHLSHEVKLQACRIDRPNCDVKIRVERQDAELVELTAVTHGPGPFSYLWSNGADTKEILVSELGDYCVEITDTAGCSDRACVDLTSDQCAVEIHVSRVSANVLTGFAILHARVKGHAPFTYLWSNGETGKNIRVSKPGEYCVTVTDALGCVARTCTIVAFDSNCKTEIEVIRTDVANTANVTLVARSKGHPPFTYAWSTGETTMSISVPPGGQYCVRVTDSTGCTSHDCIDLDRRECGVEIQVKPSDQLQDSTVALLARAKGRAPFSYLWSTGDTTAEIRVLKHGEYCVTITDASGCEARDCIRIGPRDQCKTEIAVSLQPNSVDPTFALVARTKGRAPFSYLWSTGETTQSIVPQENTEYCVEVIDAAGCASSDCIDLSDLRDSCKVEIKSNPNGLLIALSRGAPVVKYLWNTGAMTKHIRVTEPGEYCVTITNVFGCESTACVEIDGITDSICSVKIFRSRNNDKKVELTARVNGIGDFQFLWSTGDTTQSIVVDSSGEYCVTAFNSQCKAEDCIKINFGIGNGLVIGDIHGSANVMGEQEQPSVAPNPFQNRLNLSLRARVGGISQIDVFRIDGKLVFTTRHKLVKGLNNVVLELGHLESGYYLLRFSDDQSIATTKIIKT